MSPSPLSLAATVTYHRIILISCGKTAGRSCRSSRTFVYFAVYVRFSVASGKKEPVTPTSGGVTGVGWPISTLLDRLHPFAGARSTLRWWWWSVSRFQRADNASSTRKIRIALAHSRNSQLRVDSGLVSRGSIMRNPKIYGDSRE